MTVATATRADLQSSGPICIVDDDQAVADSLQVLLETNGFSVQCFASGQEFLAGAPRRCGCLVIDHHIPGMNGLDVIDRLRREAVDLPVILISGRLDPAIRQRAAGLGVTKILDKPFSVGRITGLIHSALAERRR